MDDQQVEDIVKCPECGGRSLTRDETRGEVTCDDCGLVLEDNVIDQGAEWRVFSPEQGDQRARTGHGFPTHLIFDLSRIHFIFFTWAMPTC